jgi:polypeptide N-acetylgalactosaminyltransferase
MSASDVTTSMMQQGNMCLDTLGHLVDNTLGIFLCHNSGGNQEWWFTKDNRIKHHDVCLSLSEQQIGAPLLMRFCDSSENQKWHQVEKGGLVKHSRLSLCIDSKDYKTRGLTAERCDSSSPSQHWSFAVKKL